MKTSHGPFYFHNKFLIGFKSRLFFLSNSLILYAFKKNLLYDKMYYCPEMGLNFLSWE